MKKDRGDEAEYVPGTNRAPDAEPNLFESTKEYIKGAEERRAQLTPVAEFGRALFAISEAGFASDREQRDREQIEREIEFNKKRGVSIAQVGSKSPAEHSDAGEVAGDSPAAGISPTVPHDLTRAYARSSDPATSVDAADKASLRMNDSRAAVLECFHRAFREVENIPKFGHRTRYSEPHGAEGARFTDAELVVQYNRHREQFDWPPQTDSGIRSRRADLVKMNKLRKVGITKNDRGSTTTLWGLA